MRQRFFAVLICAALGMVGFGAQTQTPPAQPPQTHFELHVLLAMLRERGETYSVPLVVARLADSKAPLVVQGPERGVWRQSG